MVRVLSHPWRLLCMGLFVAATLALAGCGDKEPVQRQAFIDFLNTEILDKKGVSLPELGTTQERAFGDYAKQYKILVRFQKAMADDAAKNARDLLALAELEDLAAVAKAEQSLRKASREAKRLQQRVGELQATADADKAKLTQPEDLFRTYDAAYNKIVTVPAKSSSDAFAAVNTMFSTTLELLDFINTHSRDLEIDGKNINVRNPGLMRDLNEKMDAVRKRAVELRQAYAAMMTALLQ